MRLVIDLAHALDKRAVAEGVESAEALDLLRELGCDEAQGYFIARPLAADAIPQAILTHRESDWFKRLAASGWAAHSGQASTR